MYSVSGRASHITKLRSEFDTGKVIITFEHVSQLTSDLIGVDYDLTDCAPGDLDPHAVASIFKAYLRERELHVFLPPMMIES